MAQQCLADALRPLVLVVQRGVVVVGVERLVVRRRAEPGRDLRHAALARDDRRVDGRDIGQAFLRGFAGIVGLTVA